MLSQSFDGRFATLIAAHLLSRGPNFEVRVAVAGHPAALIARAAGGAEELGGSGTLVGVIAEPLIEESATLLEPGDSLALYPMGCSRRTRPREW